MKKITLHHAPLFLKGDIGTQEFDTWFQLLEHLHFRVFDSKPKVYLLVLEKEFTEIIVTESQDFIKKLIQEYEGVVHLQEYSSFESAYAVSLDMREDNELCYDIDVSSLN